MAPVGERRTLKPVIIIPPQGTSSHAALHYNPSYRKAQVYHLQNYLNKKKHFYFLIFRDHYPFPGDQ